MNRQLTKNGQAKYFKIHEIHYIYTKSMG